MKLHPLFNSLVSKLRSIFVLQFHVVKTLKQFENNKQLIEINLSYNSCIFLFVNGKRVPKVQRILVKAINKSKVITFRAIGLFQIKNIILEVEPSVMLNTNLSKQLSSKPDNFLANKKSLKPTYSSFLMNKINPKLRVNSLDFVSSRALNNKMSQLKSTSPQYIL
jgi:hypothetical protein